jgi:hypothetical protein
MLNRDEIISELKRFQKYIITQSRANLTRGDKNVNKKLYNSLGGDVFVSKSTQSIGIYFEMEEYGQYQDLGVKGKSSSSKAPNSPYKFGTGTGKKGGLTEGINKWVKQRRFQFRDNEGKFLSYDSTSFLITRSIYNKGIKPSLFFTKPFEKAFERLPDELVTKYALNVENLIKTSING